MTAMLRNLRKWVRGVDREVNGLVRSSSNDGSDALVLSRSGGGWVFARRAGSRKPRVSRCPSSEEPPLRGFTAEKRARNNILVCFGASSGLTFYLDEKVQKGTNYLDYLDFSRMAPNDADGVGGLGA